MTQLFVNYKYTEKSNLGHRSKTPHNPPHQKTKWLEATEFEALKQNSSAMCPCTQKQPLCFRSIKWCHIRSFAVILKQLRKDHELQ
jgi:hypothetical protein